jgi:hypothetical protein
MICDLEIQPVSEDAIKLLIEESEVRVLMLWSIPTVVPVIGESALEEISVRTNGQILLETRAKPTEKVFESGKGSCVISVPSVVMWPQRVEENTRQTQKVKTSVLIEPKRSPRDAAIDLTASVQ